jgi:hypothetical protein
MLYLRKLHRQRAQILPRQPDDLSSKPVRGSVRIEGMTRSRVERAPQMREGGGSSGRH